MKCNLSHSALEQQEKIALDKQWPRPKMGKLFEYAPLMSWGGLYADMWQQLVSSYHNPQDSRLIPRCNVVQGLSIWTRTLLLYFQQLSIYSNAPHLKCTITFDRSMLKGQISLPGTFYSSMYTESLCKVTQHNKGGGGYCSWHLPSLEQEI